MKKFSNTRYNLFAIKLAVTRWLTAPLRWLDIISWIKLYRIYRIQRNDYFAALDKIGRLERDVKALRERVEHYRSEYLRMCENVAICEAAVSKWQRALREHKRRADLDSRLGDALRASGINAADALAVQALYATAGQSGSHRIVSALRAIEAWLREGGAL